MAEQPIAPPDEQRWWEMQLGVHVRGGDRSEEPPPRTPEKREHRSFHLTRTSDEHHWWEKQLGKNLQRKKS